MKILSIVLQFILFLVVFFAFSLFPPMHIEHVLSAGHTGTRVFVADGLICMLVLYAVIVLIQVLTRRLRTSAPWTTLAAGLALVLGFAMKFGLLTRSSY